MFLPGDAYQMICALEESDIGFQSMGRRMRYRIIRRTSI